MTPIVEPENSKKNVAAPQLTKVRKNRKKWQLLRQNNRLKFKNGGGSGNRKSNAADPWCNSCIIYKYNFNYNHMFQ